MLELDLETGIELASKRYKIFSEFRDLYSEQEKLLSEIKRLRLELDGKIIDSRIYLLFQKLGEVDSKVGRLFLELSKIDTEISMLFLEQANVVPLFTLDLQNETISISNTIEPGDIALCMKKRCLCELFSKFSELDSKMGNLNLERGKLSFEFCQNLQELATLLPKSNPFIGTILQFIGLNRDLNNSSIDELYLKIEKITLELDELSSKRRKIMSAIVIAVSKF